MPVLVAGVAGNSRRDSLGQRRCSVSDLGLGPLPKAGLHTWDGCCLYVRHFSVRCSSEHRGGHTVSSIMGKPLMGAGARERWTWAGLDCSVRQNGEGQS